METVYDSIQNNDNKMVTGDSYSKLEPKGVYRGVTGKHSLHPGTNNNGQLLIVQQARV
jgi:hypothetical protein